MNEKNFSGAQERQRNAAQARSRSASDITKCYVCEKSLFISFFFDAMGHDRIKDKAANRPSNIAKIFDAHHPLDKSKGIYLYYYEGIGTDLRNANEAKAAMASLGHVAGQTAKGVLKDQARPPVGQAAQQVGQQVLQGGAPDLRGAARQVGDDWLKGATNPKSYAEAGARALLSSVVEITPGLRDHEFSASVMNSGVPARLNQALGDFDKTLAGETGLVIHKVEVAVFGAERGGSLARAFVNELIAKRGKRQGDSLMVQTPRGLASLHLRFVGLFDSQSAVWQPGGLWKPLSLFRPVALATAFVGPDLRERYNLDLPREVESALHLVSANDTRAICALDTIAKGSAQKMVERVLPGSEVDAFAGLAPQERGKSVELARVPARLMCNEAALAGVPVYSVDQLEQIDPDTWTHFRLKERITLPGSSVSRSVLSLVRSWESTASASSGDLTRALLAHQKLLIGLLRLQHEIQPTRLSHRCLHEARTLHYRGQGWTEPVERELLNAWMNPPALPLEVVALYTQFMHMPRLNLGNDLTLQDMSIMTTRPLTGNPDLLDEAKKKNQQDPEIQRRHEEAKRRMEEQDRQREAARQKDRERAGIR